MCNRYNRHYMCVIYIIEYIFISNVIHMECDSGGFNRTCEKMSGVNISLFISFWAITPDSYTSQYPLFLEFLLRMSYPSKLYLLQKVQYQWKAVLSLSMVP